MMISVVSLPSLMVLIWYVHIVISHLVLLQLGLAWKLWLRLGFFKFRPV